jgi:hypothetical protein
MQTEADIKRLKFLNLSKGYKDKDVPKAIIACVWIGVSFAMVVGYIVGYLVGSL